MPSMREMINPRALVNWYRLLWHMTVENPNKNIPFLDLNRFERALFYLLHHHPRDDLAIVVCVLKIWALARNLIIRNSDLQDIEYPSFDTVESLPTLAELENAVAFLCGVPVPEKYIPPLYRQNPPLGQAGVEITDTGLLHLFAIWHERVVKDAYLQNCNFDLAEGCSDIFVDRELEIDIPPYNLTDDDFRLLDRILGLGDIPTSAIYSFYSNPNPFTLIKQSGCDFNQQTKMATLLFDHEPNLYKDSVLGMIMIFARGQKMPLLVNDEILFYMNEPLTKKTAMWIVYSSEAKYTSLMVNGRFVVHIDISTDQTKHIGPFLSRVFYSVTTAGLSTVPEAAMEEGT